MNTTQGWPAAKPTRYGCHNAMASAAAALRLSLASHRLRSTASHDTPRFPNDKASAAAERVAEALDQLGAGPEDVALSQAAAGGDLLFLEGCQQRAVRCEILLPFN